MRHGNGRCLTDEQPPSEEVAEEFKSLVSEEQPPDEEAAEAFKWPCPFTNVIVQELCESGGGRPGLSVLTSLLVSVDVKIYCTMLRHWSQLVPNMSTDI